MEMPPSPPKPLERDAGTRFADMTHGQKWIFMARVVVCVGTFGYVFPNVQND
jgi:hypothetical protein